MSDILDYLKKLVAAREVITALLTALQIAFYMALVSFIASLVSILFDLYQLIKELFDMTTSGTLAGSSGVNDFNAIAWSMLESYGVLEVFRTFLPLIFSAMTMYITLFATRMLLDFKAKAIKSMHRAANLFLKG